MNTRIAGDPRATLFPLVFLGFLGFVIVVALMVTVRSVGLSTLYGHEMRLKITNRSGKDLVVTSGHTGKSYQVDDQSSVVVPHASGDVSITQSDATQWFYKNVDPIADPLHDFRVVYHYPVPAGGCAMTVHLILLPSGTMYVVPPEVVGTVDPLKVDPRQLKQPTGFPRTPETGTGTL